MTATWRFSKAASPCAKTRLGYEPVCTSPAYPSHAAALGSAFKRRIALLTGVLASGFLLAGSPALAQESWVVPLTTVDFNKDDAALYTAYGASSGQPSGPAAGDVISAPSGSATYITAQSNLSAVPQYDAGLPLAVQAQGVTSAAGTMLNDMGVTPTALGEASDLPDIHAPALEAPQGIYASTPLQQDQAIPSASPTAQYSFDEGAADGFVVSTASPQPTSSTQIIDDVSVAPPQPVPAPQAASSIDQAPRQARFAQVSGASASPSFSDAIPDRGLAPTDFSFVLGGGLAVRPDYLGSNNYEIAPNILFDISFKDTVFLSSKHGLGVVPFKNDMFYSDLHLKYWPARGDSGDLDGMVPVDPSMAVGATVGFRSDWVDVDLSGDWGVLGGNTGLDATLSASHWFDISDSFALRPKAYISMSDNSYNDTLFGINTAEAAAVNAALAAAGRSETVSVYDPNGGFREVGSSLDLEYAFSPNFSVITSAEMSLLLGDARNSPLVEELGSPFQWGLGLLGVYRF